MKNGLYEEMDVTTIVGVKDFRMIFFILVKPLLMLAATFLRQQTRFVRSFFQTILVEFVARYTLTVPPAILKI